MQGQQVCFIEGVGMPDLHVRRGEKVLGPFPPDKIKQMITDDKIKPSDLIQVGGDDQWIAIGDIPNLAKLFGSDNAQATKQQKSSEPDSASSDPLKMFVKRGDVIHGPLTLMAVQDGIAAGKIDRSDQVGPRKTGPWKEAGSLSRLFPTDEVVSDEFAGFDLGEDESEDHTYGLARTTPLPTARPGLIFDDEEEESVPRQSPEGPYATLFGGIKNKRREQKQAGRKPKWTVSLECWKCERETILESEHCSRCGSKKGTWTRTGAAKGGNGLFCTVCRNGYTDVSCRHCGQMNTSVNLRATRVVTESVRDPNLLFKLSFGVPIMVVVFTPCLIGILPDKPQDPPPTKEEIQDLVPPEISPAAMPEDFGEDLAP